MRMVTITIAATMLLMGMPAYAHDAPESIEDRDRKLGITEYTNSLTVEDDARIQPGWWGDHGVSLDSNQDGEDDPETSASEQPEWVWVSTEKHEETTNVFATVTTHGALAGAVDVFKYRFPEEDSDSQITPNCPQQLVEEQYPESLDAPGLLTRVVRETVEHHQRAGSFTGPPGLNADGHVTGYMNLTLDMSRTDTGYLVAFYPQAATGADAVADGVGDAWMEWSFAPQQDKMDIRDNLQTRQPDLPVEISEWAGDTSDVIDCANRGVVPPEIPENGAAVPDLPGDTPGADDLMGADLPDDL